jgi:HlyD family secretion protein
MELLANSFLFAGVLGFFHMTASGKRSSRWLGLALALLAVAAVLAFSWSMFRADEADGAIASGNGRIEAVEIDIAAKAPGRVEEILVKEGEFVTAGQVLARMDTRSLEAQLRQAEAERQRAEDAVATAQSQLALRESEHAAARATVSLRETELEAARRRAARTLELSHRGAVSEQDADDARTAVHSAEAALSAARAQVSAAAAAITAARAQVNGAISAQRAAEAAVARVQAEIDDSVLVAPRDGRVQYLVAQPGEVLGAGGRVLNLVDLSDVYINFFLPTAIAGRIALGSEARIILDAAPQYVIPASISFVADVAQFTPRMVETRTEREKLMFRVRARIPPELLRKHILQVKTGLPGVAYVRVDSTKPWPPELEVRLPQ